MIKTLSRKAVALLLSVSSVALSGCGSTGADPWLSYGEAMKCLPSVTPDNGTGTADVGDDNERPLLTYDPNDIKKRVLALAGGPGDKGTGNNHGAQCVIDTFVRKARGQDLLASSMDDVVLAAVAAGAAAATAGVSAGVTAVLATSTAGAYGFRLYHRPDDRRDTFFKGIAASACIQQSVESLRYLKFANNIEDKIHAFHMAISTAKAAQANLNDGNDTTTSQALSSAITAAEKIATAIDAEREAFVQLPGMVDATLKKIIVDVAKQNSRGAGDLKASIESINAKANTSSANTQQLKWANEALSQAAATMSTASGSTAKSTVANLVKATDIARNNMPHPSFSAMLTNVQACGLLTE